MYTLCRLLTDTPVALNTSISILLVTDANPGDFCCGAGYNVTSGRCYFPDEDASFTPFSIPNSHIIDHETLTVGHPSGIGHTGEIVVGVLAALLLVAIGVAVYYAYRFHHQRVKGQGQHSSVFRF